MTELALSELQFDAKINSSIELTNEETLNSLVTAIENKYSTLVYTDENEQEAKKDRAELNKVIKQIDEQRKKVKKEFNIPLSEFESKLKDYSSRISNVISPIDTGIKDLEQRQKEQRLQDIKSYIDEVAPNYDIEPSEIEIQNNWLNKSLSNIQRQRLITDAMTLLKQQKEHKENEINIVKSFCGALEIDSDAWLLQLEQGKTSAEIMKLIEESIQRKKEQEEVERQREIKRKELLEQQETERRKRESEQYEQEKKRIKEESSSVVEELVNEPVEPLVEPEEETQTLILKFTATSSQLNMLSQFIVDNEIQVEKI
ncbi:uncharacterized protein DUF1351 [Vagococcus fluvialis]|uniref:DUF1351 domain-containing protein n=1 Tax=Vagococcus fluvialis TaxID=2738 RepID=A0A369B1V8_9ENTE|nr:DUF1351 domain-containing protein [Vagococcus fluvialis]RCX15305.1 uncharacterized protein DUF1351 [Vagococcus fluvialis]RSU05426.1 hypothetical protein CBF32_00055 [Vagococcus fluvialis]